jgi:hypothetical protein
MQEAIEIGYQTFVSDGGEEFGAVREVSESENKKARLFNLASLSVKTAGLMQRARSSSGVTFQNKIGKQDAHLLRV